MRSALALLSVSIGLTGGILIFESARTSREQVRTDQQLFAENRAFALRDNLQILEGELDRLSLLPQLDLSDDNPEPEARLLEYAHTHSVLYNAAVLLLSDSGECVGAVPDRPDFKNRRFGDMAWFRDATWSEDVPLFRTSDDPVVGRTLNIVQPIFRKKRFAGALVGVITLDQANVIVSAITDKLPLHTEVMLVDQQGQTIFATGSVLREAGWERAIAASRRGGAGTLSASVRGETSLFAYAPVEASSGYAVVFRRPWTVLVQHLQRVLLFDLDACFAQTIGQSVFINLFQMPLP